MAHKANEVATMPLAGTEKGKIEVAVISEPYGKGSAPVASVGIFLNGDNDEPDWKVHIPGENIGQVVEALQEAMKKL